MPEKPVRIPGKFAFRVLGAGRTQLLNRVPHSIGLPVSEKILIKLGSDTEYLHIALHSAQITIPHLSSCAVALCTLLKKINYLIGRFQMESKSTTCISPSVDFSIVNLKNIIGSNKHFCEYC